MFKRIQITVLPALFAFMGSTVHAQSLPLDATFGTGGISYLSNVPAYYPIDMALQTDGKILCLYSSSGNTYVIRTHADGSIDNTFIADLGYQLFPTAVPGALQFTGKSCTPNSAIIRQTADGKVIVAMSGYGIMRLKAGGSVDSTFGNLSYAPGFLDLNFYNPVHILANVHDMRDALTAGHYYIGPCGISGSGLMDTVVVAKTTKDGDLDAGYGVAGVKLIPLDSVKFGFYNEIRKAMFTDDGKILITGTCRRNSFPANNNDVFVARFKMDGTPDLTFGTGGVNIIDFGGYSQEPFAITAGAGGNIYISGKQNSAGRQYFTIKLSAAGVLDASYGSSGQVLSTPPTCDDATPNDITTTSYGKLFMSCIYSTGFMVLKDEYFSYNADGSPNTTFAPGGAINNNTYEKAVKLMTLSDNKILILGADASHPRIMRITGDALPSIASHLSTAEPKAWVANGMAYVAAENNSKNLEAALFAIDGRLLKQYNNTDFTANGNVKTIQLPTDMAHGIYLLSVRQKSGVQQVKFSY